MPKCDGDRNFKKPASLAPNEDFRRAGVRTGLRAEMLPFPEARVTSSSRRAFISFFPTLGLLQMNVASNQWVSVPQGSIYATSNSLTRTEASLEQGKSGLRGEALPSEVRHAKGIPLGSAEEIIGSQLLFCKQVELMKGPNRGSAMLQ